MKHKNVLVVMTDQHSFRCFSHMNHPDVKTPNIDRLAADGVVFENAHTQSPVCLPARVSFLTAQYVHTHRQFGFEGMQAPDTPLMPRAFKEAGYRTAMVGKLHIGSLPRECGAEFVSSTLCEDSWRVLGGGTAYEDYVKEKGYAYPTDQTHGGIPNEVAPKSADPSEPHNVQMSGTSDIPLEDSVERWTANEALRYFKETEADERPFWMWLTFDRPHSPRAVSSPYDTFYDPDKLTLSPYETVDQVCRKPLSHFRDMTVASVTNESYLRRVLASYYGLITHIDAEIGRVLEYLDEQGLYDDTTIVFTSDHGDYAGIAHIMEKTRGVGTGEVTRIPFIIKPANSTVKNLRKKEEVELIDIWPTVAAHSGLGEQDKRIDGKDLSPVFSGETLPERTVMCEHYTERSIAKNGFRYVHYLEHPEMDELYDSVSDPEERDNLCALPESQNKRIELKMEMIKKLSPEFDESDTETIDRYVMQHKIRHIKWRPTQRVDYQTPISVNEGRGLWLVNSEKYQLFLRLDGGKHVVYRTADYFEDRVDIYGTDEFDTGEFEHHLNLLLDWLFLRYRPIDIVGASLMWGNAESFPKRDEVETFLAAMDRKEPWSWTHRYYQPHIIR